MQRLCLENDRAMLPNPDSCFKAVVMIWEVKSDTAKTTNQVKSGNHSVGRVMKKCEDREFDFDHNVIVVQNGSVLGGTIKMDDILCTPSWPKGSVQIVKGYLHVPRF